LIQGYVLEGRREFDLLQFFTQKGKFAHKKMYHSQAIQDIDSHLEQIWRNLALKSI